MTLLERNGRYVARPVLIGLAVVALELVCANASAEGSFFKNRRDGAPASAVATAKPVAVATATPSGAPAEVPASADPVAAAPSASPSPPVPSPPPPAPPPSSPPPVVPTPAPAAPVSTGVSGAVADVLSTDTFIVAGQQVQIAGVRGRPMMLAGLKGWLQNNGNQLNCRAVGPRYRCVTPNGKDVGLVVLENGAAEADANASAEYRAAVSRAQSLHKGIWAQR